MTVAFVQHRCAVEIPKPVDAKAIVCVTNERAVGAGVLDRRHAVRRLWWCSSTTQRGRGKREERGGKKQKEKGRGKGAGLSEREDYEASPRTASHGPDVSINQNISQPALLRKVCGGAAPISARKRVRLMSLSGRPGCSFTGFVVVVLRARTNRWGDVPTAWQRNERSVHVEPVCFCRAFRMR